MPVGGRKGFKNLQRDQYLIQNQGNQMYNFLNIDGLNDKKYQLLIKTEKNETFPKCVILVR